MQRFIDFQGTKVSYQIEGKGPSLLLLHGFCDDAEVWATWKKALTPDYQVICPEIFGFGQSALQEGYSLEDMAAAIASILAQEAIDQTVFIGHSMGGYIALAFAEQFSHRLRGLGLFHSHPFADDEEKRAGRLKAAAFVTQHGAATYLDTLLPNTFAPRFIAQYPERLAQIKAVKGKIAPEGIAHAAMAMYHRPSRAAQLQTLSLPVLLLLGEEDVIITPPLQEATIAALPPAAQAVVFPAVGHSGMIEAPALTQTAVMEFLKRLSH